MSANDPGEDYDDEPWKGRVTPEYIVRWPASIMWVAGLIQFIFIQLWIGPLIAFLALGYLIADKTLADVWQFALKYPAIWISFLGWPLASACSIVMMVGANDLAHFRRYYLVVAAASLTLLSIPVLPLAIVQLPVGIWTLWLLFRRDIRARFEAVARGTILAPQSESSHARRAESFRT